MNLESILLLFIGGGGVGALVSAFFTRKSQKESTEIDLLDRAYKEINRLDMKIDELESELKKERDDNVELRRIIAELRAGMQSLKDDLEEYERNEM